MENRVTSSIPVIPIIPIVPIRSSIVGQQPQQPQVTVASVTMTTGSNTTATPSMHRPVFPEKRESATSTTSSSSSKQYDDFVKMPEIPTKLNNLVLPDDPKNKKRSSFRSPPSASSSFNSGPSRSNSFTSTMSIPRPQNAEVLIDDAAPNSWFVSIVSHFVSKFLAVSGLARKRIANEIVDKVVASGAVFKKFVRGEWVPVDKSGAEKFTMQTLERLVAEKIPATTSFQPHRHSWHVKPSSMPITMNFMNNVTQRLSAVARGPSPQAQATKDVSKRHSWHVKADKSPARVALKTKFKVPKARQVSLESDNPLAFLSQIAAACDYSSDGEEES